MKHILVSLWTTETPILRTNVKDDEREKNKGTQKNIYKKSNIRVLTELHQILLDFPVFNSDEKSSILKNKRRRCKPESLYGVCTLLKGKKENKIGPLLDCSLVSHVCNTHGLDTPVCLGT